MATNEILPFCATDTGTNLLTQAEYDADSQRPIGNQPGVARSKLVNKVLKQSSLLAAALAQYLADKQATDITDDMTPSAIAALIDSVISASISVPDASTTVKGKVQLATNAEAQALSNELKAITPSTLDNASKGSNQSLTTNGYQKLPGGLIVQWGTTSAITVNTNVTITLPITFPNAGLNGQATMINSDSSLTKDNAANVVSISTNQIIVRANEINANQTAAPYYWLAIGY